MAAWTHVPSRRYTLPGSMWGLPPGGMPIWGLATGDVFLEVPRIIHEMRAVRILLGVLSYFWMHLFCTVRSELLLVEFDFCCKCCCKETFVKRI